MRSTSFRNGLVTARDHLVMLRRLLPLVLLAALAAPACSSPPALPAIPPAANSGPLTYAVEADGPVTVTFTGPGGGTVSLDEVSPPWSTIGERSEGGAHVTAVVLAGQGSVRCRITNAAGVQLAQEASPGTTSDVSCATP